MKKVSILLICVTLVFASCSKKKKISKPHLSNGRDSVAYFIGVFTGKSIKTTLNSVEFGKFNQDVYLKAIEDVMNGDSIKYTDMYMNDQINGFIQKLQKQAGEKTFKEGQAFLENNKKNPGVVVLPSGLQYQVIKQGNGPKPDSSDVLSVNYRGLLINGEEFESNPKDQPAKLQVNRVIAGMTEALLKMNVGSKWKLFIPTNLAYGERPRQGGKIKPNMALIFELEVLAIEPKQAQPQQDQAPMDFSKMMKKRK